MTDMAGYQLGYILESTEFGKRERADPTTNTQVFSFGSVTRALPAVPTEEKTYEEVPAYDSYNVSKWLIGKKFVIFPVEYSVLEGVRFLYFLGEYSKAGPVGNIYTHTMTETEPANGSTLPSATFHLQSRTGGLTTQYAADLCGMTLQKFELIWHKAKPANLICKELNFGQRLTSNESSYTSYDLDGTVDGDSSEKAVIYGSAYPPTLIDSSLTKGNTYYCSDIRLGGDAGTNYIGDIRQFHLSAEHTLDVEPDNREGYDNYGRAINQYPGIPLMEKRRYILALTYKWTDATSEFFRVLQQEVQDNDLFVKFKRLVGVEDHELSIKFDESISPATQIKGPLLHRSPDELKTITFKPRSIDEMISKDEISGDYSSY